MGHSRCTQGMSSCCATRSAANLHQLRDFMEGIVEAESEDGTELEADSFEILKQAPLIGDDKFKLEIGTSPCAL